MRAWGDVDEGYSVLSRCVFRFWVSLPASTMSLGCFFLHDSARTSSSVLIAAFVSFSVWILLAPKVHAVYSFQMVYLVTSMMMSTKVFSRVSGMSLIPSFS
jgi:hypothetical protein